MSDKFQVVCYFHPFTFYFFPSFRLKPMDSIYSVPDLVMTQDGSFTLFSKQHGVTYHSRYGAIQESNHVFIDSGFLPVTKEKDTISIIEIGFGTGLNVLLTWKNKEVKKNLTIKYHSFDIFPLPESILNACVYRELLNIPTYVSDQILKSSWDIDVQVDEQFSLKKICKDILKENLPSNFYDVVYFDAFSPESQPELWSTFIFEKLFVAMQQGGILVTYCAKGEVKRTLKKIGFTLESLPGPPGKREMTRATKPF